MATGSLLAGALGCGHDGPVVPPPPGDTTAPVVRIVYPPPDSVTLYDRDSNGLLDLEIAWTDSAGRVDPTTVRVTCAPDCIPGVALDTNLARGWRVVRQDSAALALEETVPLLLRGGERTLTLRATVADTVGNVSAPAQVTVFLPPGAFNRSISLGGRPSCQPERGVDFAFSPDGTKGFAPYHGCVAVFDPDGIQPTHFVFPVDNTVWAAQIRVDTATGLAYIGGGGTPTEGFTVLDTRTERVVQTSPPVGAGLASVAVDGERIYAGEACTDGRIFVYDKHTLAAVGQIDVGAVSYLGSCPNAESFAFSRDHSTAWVTIVAAGVVRLDLDSLVLRDYYDLEPGWDGYFGDSREIALAADRWLYLARLREGLDLFDVAPWRLSAHGSSPKVFVTLSLSPDQRAVVLNQIASVPYGGIDGSTPQLYDVGPTLALRHGYPVRLGLTTDEVRFHPDGKRFFVMAEYQVNVYLVRPR